MSQKIEIVKGEDVDITIDLKKSDGRPFDLTGATEIEGCFVNDDDTILKLNLAGGVAVSGSALLGIIILTLTEAQTDLLKAENNQDFEVEVTQASGKKKKAQFLRALDVRESICDQT